ncbi:MAG: hypothetical protein ABH811_00555, partial [archaeon]
MGRTRLAKAVAGELKERIKVSEKRKRELILYLQRLKEIYSKGKISYSKHIEIIYSKRDGKTINEWIEYYDQEIISCEQKLKKQKKKIIQRYILLGFFSIVLISFLFYIRPTLIGFVTQEQEFTQSLNFESNQSTIYEWLLENQGTLFSVKLSGLIEGSGEVKIYLDDLLILDSSKIKKIKGITGQIVDEENKGTSDFFKKFFGFFKIVGRVVGETEVKINESFDVKEETNESYSDINEEILEDSSPSQESPLSEKEEPLREIEIREFSGLCEETCDLSIFNLNKSSYLLRIEISNSKLILNEIKYKTLPEIITEDITKIRVDEEVTEIITKRNATEITTREDISEIIAEENVIIKTQQYPAVIGQPVKWKKNVELLEQGIVRVKVPKQAENITVNKLSNSEIKEEAPEDSSPSLEPSSSEKQISNFKITGKIISNERKSSFFDFFKNLFSKITGRAVDIEDTEEFKEIIIEDNAKNYEIEYETPAPYAIEELTEIGKRVKIVGPEYVHYENVLSFTELSEDLNIDDSSRVKIYWVENESYIPIQNIEDRDSNGIYDYIEWIAPVLSNQTFEIGIVIINAEHLNPGRKFIENIYDYVKEVDNLTYTIPKNNYVRAYFEKDLISGNVIDIYVHGTEQATIEVYEKDSDFVVGKIENITTGIYYIELNHTEYQSVFDLKSIGGDVVYDYIHDASSITENGFGPFAQTPINIGQETTVNLQVTTTGRWSGTIFLETTADSQITTSCGSNQVNLTGCSITAGCSCAADYTVSCTNINAAMTITWTVRGCTLGASTYRGGWTGDQSGNGAITANLQVKAPDFTYPTFSSFTETPADSPIYSQGATYEFNTTIADTNGTVWIQFDGSNRTATNLSTDIYNWTKRDLSAGVHSYNWGAYGSGTDHNLNTSLIYDYTINQAVPQGSISGISPIEYPALGNVEGSESNMGDDNVGYGLFRDGASVTNPDNTIIFGAGTYNYIYNATAGTNYTTNSSIGVFTLIVNKNSSLVLDLSASTPIEYGDTTDFTGSGCPSELSCSLNISNAVYGVGT